MEEAEEYNLEAMNKSIQKQKVGGGMKRNAKSFNFTQKQLTDYITNQEKQMCDWIWPISRMDEK